MRWLLAMALVACGTLSALEPANVLVVYNEKVEGSKEIADYYAGLRGVPAEQVLKISASDQEEISRDDFNKDVMAPVREYVVAHTNILCIVPTRGVPLKIRDQDGKTKGQLEGHDEASVDSELTLARAGDYPIDGSLDNAYLRKETPLKLEDGVVVVCRLDGPTVAIAKGLVEKAILAEALGPEGQSFLDTRGLTTNDSYAKRDDAMETVGLIWASAGINYTQDLYPEVADLSTIKDLLHYDGWYAAGHAPRGAVRFRTGAIAMHLHSFSAVTIRQEKAWVGPLLAWNATCSMGTVYEPYIDGFPFEDVFWDRLTKGWQFGEAGLCSNRMISWQSIFVGDPLYQPYPQGWKDRKDRARKAVAARMTPGTEKADETSLVLIDACARLLSARADNVNALAASDPKAGMDAFQSLRFLVAGFALDAWLATLSKPFEPEFRRRLEAMRTATREDLTQTAELEVALVEWKGLSIYADLEKFRDELGRNQEGKAKTLLRKAQTSQKNKQWLKAWREAAEAAAHRFAPSATEALNILDVIKPQMTSVKIDANKELKVDVEKAQKAFEKKKYAEAKKALGTDWKYYPQCEQRIEAEDLAKKIDEELKKGG